LGQHQHTNIYIIGASEGEETEKEVENLFEEIIAENLANLEREAGMHVQKAQRALNKMNQRRPTPRHVKTKTSKIKDNERILNAAREKQVLRYKGNPIRLSVFFFTKTLQARME